MKKNIPPIISLLLFPFFLLSQTYSISGKIHRHNFDPVEGFELVATFNNDTITTYTNSDGDFILANIPQGSEVNFSYNQTFSPIENVTVLDLLVARDALLFLNINSTPLQMLAGDMDNSGSFTSDPIVEIDLVLINQLLLNITPNFQIDSSWSLVPLGFTLGTDTIPTTISTIVNNDISDFDFIAIKRGDLAIEKDYAPPPPDASQPTFTISNESFDSGDEVVFEIRVQDFQNIAGWQYTLKWDTTILEWVDAQVLSSSNFAKNTNLIYEGFLPFSIEYPPLGSPIISDNEVLMSVTFNALTQSDTSSSVLEFADTLTRGQVVWYNPQWELFVTDGNYLNEDNISSIQQPTVKNNLKISPNPCRDFIRIDALFFESEPLELFIKNSLGQTVYFQNMDNGWSQALFIDWLPVGTYYLGLQSSKEVTFKTFIKQ